MNPPRFSFAGLTLGIPSGWVDVTDDAETKSPFTLVKSPNGIGALQFSVAKYKSGVVPDLQVDALVELLKSFFLKKGFDEPTNVQKRQTHVALVSGDRNAGPAFYRIWYVSDGPNVALVTYTTECSGSIDLFSELSEADGIVRSVLF